MKHLILVLLTFWFSTSFALPGDLLSIRVLKERTQAEINYARQKYCPAVSGNAKSLPYSSLQVRYKTLDVKGNEVVAMGLMMVPKADGPFSEVVYQHGTVFGRAELPSTGNPYGEGEAIGDCLVSLGSVGLLADYLGFGDGTGVHPYIHAASEAWVARDLMRAAQSALQGLNVSLNGKLFVLGYSQGGHAAMALHRLLEQDPAKEFTVTAAAPMAGPYALSEAAGKIFMNPSPHSPAEAAYLAVGLNEVYPIYTDIKTVFKAPYDVTVPQLLDGSHTWQDVLAVLSVPFQALFQDDFITTMTSDPNSPWRLALQDNEVYKWVPTAPVKLYHGGADTEVPYINSERAYEYMKARGADVNLVNLGEKIDHAHGFPLAVGAAALWFETL